MPNNFLIFLKHTELRVADTFVPAHRRATWFHPASRNWYELDVFVSDMPVHDFSRLRTVPVPSGDHVAKILDLQLYGR